MKVCTTLHLYLYLYLHLVLALGTCTCTCTCTCACTCTCLWYLHFHFYLYFYLHLVLALKLYLALALGTCHQPPGVEADDGRAVLVHGVEERVDDVAHRATVPQQLLEPDQLFCAKIWFEQSRTCHPASRRGFCRRNSWKSRFGLTEIKAFFLTREYSLCETSLVKPLFVLTIITISLIIIIFLLLLLIIVIISYIREIPWYGPQVRMKPRISTPVTCQCNGDAFLTNKDFRSQYLANSKDSFSAAPAHYLEF